MIEPNDVKYNKTNFCKVSVSNMFDNTDSGWLRWPKLLVGHLAPSVRSATRPYSIISLD